MTLKNDDFPNYWQLRRRPLLYGLAAGAAAITAVSPGANLLLAGTRDGSTGQHRPQSKAFATTVAYVAQFYPLWFSYFQTVALDRNALFGPDRISPLYKLVVAINDDTLYASGILDLEAQPVVLTIPETTATYSILTVDPYGNIVSLGIPKQTAGVFALTGPGFSGTLPTGMTQIPAPLNIFTLIFRSDKFAPNGDNNIAEAQVFRATIRIQALSDYQSDPSGGTTEIRPEVLFAAPFKTVADELIAIDPIKFLTQLQTAVAAPNTPPLSPSEQALSDAFDQIFGNGNSRQRSAFAKGAQAAHAKIIDTYLDNLGPTNWIHFINIGDWGEGTEAAFQRSAITEFIQYGNGIDTAAYYQTFSDNRGRALDGGNPKGYVLTFPAGQLPDAERFWSITAYTPDAIELIHNIAYKYTVASYTPGLEFNADGSLSIYMAQQLPDGIAAANWLPVADEQFNIMLRVYGPQGTVAGNTYVPPPVVNAGRASFRRRF
jgi:hypothetical protein